MGSNTRRGAQWGYLVFSLRMLATVRMWRSKDKLRELGQAGTRHLPHGSPEIKLGLQVWQQAPSYPRNHLVSPEGLFFNTNNDIIGRRQI